MPMVAAAVASAVTWVSSAAAAVSATAVGWLATPFVMAMGEGAAIAMASGVLKVAATAVGSFALNAVMAPKVGSAGSPTSFKADPSSPIRGVMGRFGTGGTQAHFRVWGKDNLMISYVVILGLGPIQGVSNFTANNLVVDFVGPDGEAAQVEPYKDKMWMTYKKGLPTDDALSPPPIDESPGMGWYGSHRTSGYAGAMWTMKNNSKKASYEGGVPKPMWEVLGQKLYDPRKDSTQISIGGSGSHRIDNWQTWEYTENPIIHALNWALGHHKKLEGGIIDRTKLLAGVGAPLSHIDLPTFVAGANVSDINSWSISGEWNTQDGKWQTLVGMLQAGSSVPVHVGAKIGVMTNAPRTHVAVIQGSDILGNTNIKVMASSRARFNTVYPRYINQSQNWEYGTAGAVSSSVYVAQDRGIERSKEITYNFVSNAKQAAQLAAYDLANTRETLKLAFASKPHHLGIKPGDAVLVNSPERGLLNQKFIVVARPIDIMEGGISFDLRSETDSKHPWALGQASRPAPSPDLSPIEPQPLPPEDDAWVVTPRPPDIGGSQQPGFVIEGEVPDGIGEVLFESGPSIEGPWKQFYKGPPTTERVPIDGLEPGSQYYVRVTYYSLKGYPSEPKVYGPQTVPSLISEDTQFVSGYPAADLLVDLQSVEALAATTAAAVADIEYDFQEIFDAAQQASQSAIDAAASAAAAAVAANTAEQEASSASASAIGAAASAGQSQASAAASAASASTASSKATEAEQAASAASAQRVLAETARSQAQTAATQAASSRDDAAGSAASASSSATNAANSRDEASGSASAAASSASTASTKAGEAGVSASAAAASQVSASTSAAQAIDALNKMGATNLVAKSRLTNPAHAVAMPSPSKSGWGIVINPSNSSRAIVVGPLKKDTAYSISFAIRRTVGVGGTQVNIDLYPDTLPERVQPVSGDGAWYYYKWEGITSSHDDMLLNNVQLRFFRSPFPAGLEFEITDIKLEENNTATEWSPSPRDIEDSARAAATSASSASASETAAGQSASAASGSATNAATSAGQAQTYSNQASSSATAAAGSATTASQASGTAVSARDTAIGARNDAQGAAATAISQASSASASASSAQISANLAASFSSKSGYNVLKNSTFSDGLNGWTAPTGWGAGTVTAPVGPHAFYFLNGTSEIRSNSVQINQTLTYTLSGDFRRLAAGGSACADLVWLNSSGTAIGFSSRIAVSADQNFTEQPRRSVTVTPPAGTARAQVRLYAENVTGNTLNGIGFRQIKLEVGTQMTAWSDDAQLVDLTAQLSITASTTADLSSRMASARFEVVAAAGGNLAQLKIRADTSGSLAQLVAGAISFSNTISGTVVKVMEITGGNVFITGVLIIGTAGGGRIEINGPAMRIDVFDESNVLRMRMGKLS